MRLDKSAQNSAFKNRRYDDDEQIFPKIPPFSLLNLNET